MKIARMGLTALAMSTSLLLLPSAVRADEMNMTTKREAVNARIDAIKSKSKERITELKAKAEQKTNEVRSKACEARRMNIENRQSNRVEAANRHKAKFDSIYGRVQSFATDNSITSVEISALEVKTNEASKKVIDEISALESLDLAIDCSNPDNVAVAVDAFKNQLTSVRSSLKDYRESIRNYSQSVKKITETNEGIVQ